MAAQDDAALEAKQQVLPDRVDRLEPPAVEALGEALQRGTRMRRLDLHALADEDLEPACRPVEGIALGHTIPA